MVFASNSSSGHGSCVSRITPKMCVYLMGALGILAILSRLPSFLSLLEVDGKGPTRGAWPDMVEWIYPSGDDKESNEPEVTLDAGTKLRKSASPPSSEAAVKGHGFTNSPTTSRAPLPVRSMPPTFSRGALPTFPPTTKTVVCTVALHARQGSLFRTNRMADHGSGKYTYVVRRHCPWEERAVRLIPFIKCCNTLGSVSNAITDAVLTNDVVVLTGDEYCLVSDQRPQFRQYYGAQRISKNPRDFFQNYDVLDRPYIPSTFMQDLNGTAMRFPLFLPLGPREEFKKVQPHEVRAAAKRKYVYNFIGSMTSFSREVLRKVVGEDLNSKVALQKWPRFIHTTDRWHQTLVRSNGYLEPERYRLVLLDSVFTLCPSGHNPEAYRIYESLESGSIPIFSLDKWYYRHDCDSSFQPFRDAGAPFVYLNGGWGGLPAFLEKRAGNETWISERQQAVRDWYSWWMGQTALRFEAILETRFQARMKRVQTEDDIAAKNREELEAEREETAIATESKLESEARQKEEEQAANQGADDSAGD